MTSLRVAPCAGLLALLLTACGGGADDAPAAADDPAALGASLPAPMNLSVAYDAKRYAFQWAPVAGATHYELLEDPDGPGPLPEQRIATDMAQAEASWALDGLLHQRLNASYRVRACTRAACGSPTAPLVPDVARAIGYFKASNTGAGDAFGSAVALSPDGRTLAVGAIAEPSGARGAFAVPPPDDDTVTRAGAVYVFVRQAGRWRQQAYLKASDSATNTQFGSALAFSGDGGTLAVGAQGTHGGITLSGAAYVFKRADDAWREEAVLTAADPARLDTFGISVALSSDGATLVVGAPGRDGGAGAYAGAVYVFTRSGASWAAQHLRAPHARAGSGFGYSVALAADGLTLAAGAPFESSAATAIDGDPTDTSATRAGAVYLFHRDSTGWTQPVYIKGSRQQGDNDFGTVVALSSTGDLLAVGAPGDDRDSAAPGAGVSATDSGAVYLFRRAAGQWSEHAFLKAAHVGAGARFGASVSLSADGQALAVGAPEEKSATRGIDGDATDASLRYPGAAYLFHADGADWRQSAYLKAPNTSATAGFGLSLSLSADGASLAVGADGDPSAAHGVQGDGADTAAPRAGAAYLY
ncbi:MAG: integrin [Pseudomonadota bacterium]